MFTALPFCIHTKLFIVCKYRLHAKNRFCAHFNVKAKFAIAFTCAFLFLSFAQLRKNGKIAQRDSVTSRLLCIFELHLADVLKRHHINKTFLKINNATISIPVCWSNKKETKSTAIKAVGQIHIGEHLTSSILTACSGCLLVGFGQIRSYVENLKTPRKLSGKHLFDDVDACNLRNGKSVCHLPFHNRKSLLINYYWLGFKRCL